MLRIKHEEEALPKPIHVARLSVQQGWHASQGAHAHPQDVEVMVVLEGRLAVRAGGKCREADRGNGIYYPAGMVHEEEALEATDFICFFVPANRGFASELVIHDPGQRLLTLARWLVEERTRSHTTRDQVMSAYVHALLIELEKCASLPPVSPVDEVRAYLLSNLARAHTLDHLALRAKMSRYHFLRVYRKQTGLTPLRDLLRMRLEAACDLLVGTDRPLKQISAETGFCDEYHFSRMFRRRYGTSPGAFRRRMPLQKETSQLAGGL